MNDTASAKATAALVCSGLMFTGCEALGPDFSKKLTLEPEQTEVAPARPDETKFQQLANPEFDRDTGESVAEFYTGSGRFLGSRAGQPAAEELPRDGKYTLNFDDADLGEVAKVILGDTLNENYVIGPGVAGRVTLQTSRPLTREELIPTLEMLLRINDTVLLRDGGGYRIEPAAKALQSAGAPRVSRRSLPSGYQIRIIPLRYVGVQGIQEILEPMIPPQSILQVDKARNLLLVAGSAAELERIIETVEIFDVDFMRGMSFGLFPLQNVDPATVLGELDALFGEESGLPLAGTVRFIPIERLNALLVVTPQPVYLSEIKIWMDRLDRARTADGGGGVNVYRVQNVDAVELAATLNEIFGGVASQRERPVSLAPGQQAARIASRNEDQESPAARSAPSRAGGGASSPVLGGMDDVRIIADPINNFLIIVAAAQQFEAIKNVIRGLDVMPLQVLIDAAIVEVSLTDNLRYGIEWFFRNHNITTALSDPDRPSGSGLGGLLENAAPLLGGFSVVFAAKDIKAVLNALASDRKINVISSPSLMVLNNQEAEITVGDSVPIATGTTAPSVGFAQQPVGDQTPTSLVSTQIQMQDTGVMLKVKPRVNAGGLVIMEIEQSVDDVRPDDQFPLNPTIAKRKINSSVAVQSGETIVLGGLIRETDSVNRRGLPFFSRLPLIGPLFGSTEKGLDKTELVVLITPRVVEDNQDARHIAREFKRKLTGIYEEVPAVETPAEPAPTGFEGQPLGGD